MWVRIMFDKFKKHSHHKQTNAQQVTEKLEKVKIVNVQKEPPSPKTNKKSHPIDKIEETIKPDFIEEKTDITPVSSYPSKELESEFMAIKDYSSFLQLSEKINKEISQTKSKLGEYLLQIDNKKVLAEKSQKILNIVSKMTGKPHGKENQDELLIDGLQIVLDATPRHELEVLENVVKSQQNRLLHLQKTKKAINELSQLGEVQGINFFVVEKHGIPEKILLTIP
jgi:hypothetical protein